jgi:hypothetical protein
MDDTTDKPSAAAEGDSEERNASDLLKMDESDFTGVVMEAVDRLLDNWGITDPRFTNFRCTGVILDKPALMITIGDAEFQIIILKTR